MRVKDYSHSGTFVGLVGRLGLAGTVNRSASAYMWSRHVFSLAWWPHSNCWTSYISAQHGLT